MDIKLPIPDTDKLNLFLKLLKGVRAADLLSLIRLTRQRKFTAGEIFIKEGETDARLFYIRKGLIRVYQTNEKDEEITLLLRWEDQFIACHDTIFFKKPSRFTYQALEETTILEADYNAIHDVFLKNTSLEPYRYQFVLHMLADSMERVESFVLQNPEERYMDLIEKRPDLVQRVPDKYLATMLGITPVSLSRIRKRILDKSGH